MGMKRKWPTFLAVEAQSLAKIYVNAGKRGLLFGVAPDQLLNLSEAKWADMAEDKT